MINVLVIDDDPKICLFFGKLLKQMGHEHKTAQTLEEGRSLFESQSFDLVLLDLELPDGNGLDLLSEFVGSASAPEVIIITGTGDVRGAELAFKYGAWDYVQKPFLLDEVTLPITRALQYRREKSASPVVIPLVRTGIEGESEPVRKCLEDVAKASATDLSVLITGETGTGKELFAKAIHENSKRAKNPFVAVDCGALPETLVESTLFGHEKGAFTGAGSRQDGLIVQAHTGTLMLDEVGDLPMAAQKSLLRTLQERTVRPIGGKTELPVDIRLVAATNLDLDQLVRAGRFREDLLYRVRAMEIKLPALRDRGKDIEAIAIKKVQELVQRYGMEPKALSPEFLKLLRGHPWPGNIRELINVLEYALASASIDPTLFPKHLPPEYRMSPLEFDPVLSKKKPSEKPERPSGKQQLPSENPQLPSEKLQLSDETGDLPTLTAYRDRMERTYLKELINRAKGDRKKACRISGISQSRLYSLLNKHGLSGFTSS